MIVVSIPAAEPEVTARSPEKAHTVFLVEVLCNGRRHTVAKRYSEFQALHKRIKKSCKVPDFPPRRVPNWVPKVLEQRRQGLELYIQELPQDVLDFLKVRRCLQDPKGHNPVVSHPPSQRPVLGFRTDPYVRLPATGKEWGCEWPRSPPGPGAVPCLALRAPGLHKAALTPLPADALPNAVLSGVLQGIYTPRQCPPCTAVPRGQLGS
ncbi:sorting nexin-22 isoform X2 [Numida meleagris]|uniref:sorting nexin-22 isoform X2 n=1 Tax=Numida meleagris TaxID=8996 RepID=UPI000B3E19E0|nr:sorting nexin-22 isoform X2 [Numida meleagris]